MRKLMLIFGLHLVRKGAQLAERALTAFAHSGYNEEDNEAARHRKTMLLSYASEMSFATARADRMIWYVKGNGGKPFSEI